MPTIIYYGSGTFDSESTGEVEHAEAVDVSDSEADFAVGHRQFVYEPGGYNVDPLRKIAGGLSDDVMETLAELEKEGENRKGALDALKTDS